MIYLETPAGVGYSYSADAAYYQGVDDKMTGTDVSIFLFLFIYFQRFLYMLQSCAFFTGRFMEYKGLPFMRNKFCSLS